ncbi:hypothetical protein [Tunicatimonas pelagia]|uniref:hypothetical protein n=1 Tax=Tunicatimonas pelagia TaxID=931531 RepID=UPI002665CA2C|nr:hypothetical protein [Tunicatimonas pelagia]WKN40826.1 hypothetical protein P0M28_17465 [Tunicatimonas pelagia]
MKKNSDLFDQIRVLSKNLLKVSELSDQNVRTAKQLLASYDLQSMDSPLVSSNFQ